MLKKIFYLLSSLPTFKGKLFLLDRFYNYFLKDSGLFLASTWTGVKLSLFMEDRIQRRIFIKKSHEYETEIHLLNFAKNSNSFIDIGANIGYFSLMIAEKFPNKSVYSFEPNPNNLIRMEANRKLNNLTNMKITNLCISDEPGAVVFSVPPENESGWGSIDNHTGENGNFTKVTSKAETLDNLYQNDFFNKTKPDLLKIDIEGFEQKAFLGARDFIKDCRPVLCVELNEECLIQNKTSASELMNLLISWGYDAFYIANNQLVKTETPISHYHYLNYFFLPNKA